jgi:hypothetical protein
VLRSTLERISGGTLTVDAILSAAEEYQDVAAVLESWWLDPSFEPNLFGAPDAHAAPTAEGARRPLMDLV